uniref:Gag-pol protein n=1 Tax=Solanum tuberosum TaxID=4113 RepID=M1A329_SOLTU
MSMHEYSLKFTQLSGYALEMVTDMRSRMSLFMSRLSLLSSKEGKTAMLIGDMDISRLMINVQQVEKDKWKDREEFRSLRAKTICHESGHQKTENVNRSSFQQRPTGSAPSLSNAHAPKNREIHYYTTSNSIVIWRRFQTPPKSIRVSLRKLFMDDCETASWSSSSEANDLKGIPSRTYCLWRPILMEESPS